MTFNKEDTLIIVGKSPILNDQNIVNKINECKNRFHVIGINQAAVIFKTEYFAFADSAQKLYYTEIHPNTKIITISRNATERFKGEFFDTYYAKDDDPPFINNKLAYRGFTHDICLSWACLKNFKNVILFGVADFTKDKTYLDKYFNLPDGHGQFNPSDKMKRDSIYYINNTLPKYINIYTINSESILSIPRVELKDI